MNYKQTVLDKIPRDKTLSFGCEVEYIKSEGVAERGYVFIEDLSGDIEGYTVVTGGMQGSEYFIERNENYIILGHPPTIADLLRVLGEGSWEDMDMYNDILYFHYDKNIDPIPLPLNYRTLLDIPESDPMWEQLSKII